MTWGEFDKSQLKTLKIMDYGTVESYISWRDAPGQAPVRTGAQGLLFFPQRVMIA
jgi:hypothetical protein